MNIVFICDDFGPDVRGGAGIIATNLAKSFVEKGHSVSAITANAKEDSQFTWKGIQINSLKYHSHKRVRNILSLYNSSMRKKIDTILSKIKVDVINVHNIQHYISYSVLPILKKHTKNIYFTAHDMVPVVGFNKLYTKRYKKKKNPYVSTFDKIRLQKTFYLPFRTSIIKSYFKSVKQVITVSDELGRGWKKNSMHKNIITIQNGIDIPKPSKISIPRGKWILFAGRTSKLKGFMQAVKIVYELRKHDSSYGLMVCGNESNVKKEWIHYTGWITQKQMSYIYDAVDMVIVPSIYLDPFPTVNLEAMAHKKPLITTLYGGSQQSIGKNAGILINPFEIEKSVQKILKADTKNLSKKGFERYQKFYTQEKMSKRYLQLFLKG